MEAIVETLVSQPPSTGFFVLVTGASRAMGVLFGLWGLTFLLGPAVLLRTVLAVILTAPVLVIQGPELVQLAAEAPRYGLLLVPVREFVLGFGIGMMISIPFFAVLAAAMLIDQYRGDFSPGNEAPEETTVGAFGSLSVILVMFLFIDAGGLMLTVRTLYESFESFPPGIPSLTVSPGFASGLGAILQDVMAALVLLALPIVLMMVLIEVGLSLIFRFAGKISFPAVDFLTKNLIFVLIMPVFFYSWSRAIEAHFARAPLPLGTLERLLGP